MTLIEERLVKNYSVLVMADVKTIDEVPENLKSYVEIRIAEIEIELLE